MFVIVFFNIFTECHILLTTNAFNGSLRNIPIQHKEERWSTILVPYSLTWKTGCHAIGRIPL